MLTSGVFLIRRELVRLSAHLLQPQLLLLLFFDLDALFSFVEEVLGFSELVAHHIEIRLHRVDEMPHFLLTDLLLCHVLVSFLIF